LKNNYDTIIVGAGAAGMMAAITAASKGKKVLLLEKLSKPGSKLKATGGGRCNLTNTLDNNTFMKHFGREGRFMTDSLDAFDHKALVAFFSKLSVESHAPDGYRIFPTSHNSQTVLSALIKKMQQLDIKIVYSQKAKNILYNDNHIIGLKTSDKIYNASSIVIATGGMGYPQLGAEGDGYELAKNVGHKITEISPAMMPLKVKESWVANCRSDTISKAELLINLKKEKKLRACGDLIFTKNGIRGPVVLDFSREITPLLKKYGEVPLLINLTKGMNENQIYKHFKKILSNTSVSSTLELLKTLLPEALSIELCKIANVDPNLIFSNQNGTARNNLIKLLAWTPLTVVGHDGFKMAMITRGGVSLKEINPKTMESKIIKGLFFCGEVMNLDGPCGGYNLQWSFSSGYVAGHLGDLVEKLENC
jgi:predicted Rossmann fold flavoprotein